MSQPTSPEPAVQPEQPATSNHDLERRARRLAAGFFALVGLTSGLIVLGALVRANGAGLACPDWPLCFGQAIPRFDLKVAFEWSHRVAAGGISIAFSLLALGALWQPELRRIVSRWIGAAALLLALQVILGALTVWELLASWTVTSHLIAGNAFNASLIVIARQLQRIALPSAAPFEGERPGGLRWLAAGSAALLLMQLVLGGMVSSTFAGLACPDWPTCVGDLWFAGFAGAQRLHLLHRLTAYALVVALVALAWKSRSQHLVGSLALAAAATGLAQTAAGIANVLLRIPVEVTGLHSGLATALVLLVSLCVLETWRSDGSQQ